tara:strand:- start:25891 stop:26964 length:1074 start_codon:yes stop_codon:yes gene_type:complete
MYKHSQSFSDFVTEALYSPNGYYRKKVDIGTKGDFYTSPSQTPLFGRALASSFSKTIIENKILGEISLIEIAPNDGSLMKDVLDFFLERHPEIYDRLIVYLVETNNSKKNDILIKLKKHKKRFSIKRSIAEVKTKTTGIIFCNELFDSLPFDRCVFRENKLYQINIRYDSNKKEPIPGSNIDGIKEYEEEACKDLIKKVSMLKLKAKENFFFEFPNSKTTEYSYENFFDSVSKNFTRAFFLIIDYGNKSEFYNTTEDPFGTARCFYKHKVSRNFYENIYSQDITHDVNFSLLSQIATSYGFKELLFNSQSKFLIENNILDIYQSESKYMKKNSIERMKNLLLPNSMGEKFKILLLTR